MWMRPFGRGFSPWHEMARPPRAFSLSDQIDQAGIEATVKDGVLRLHLPKVTEARTRKIAIKAG